MLPPEATPIDRNEPFEEFNSPEGLLVPGGYAAIDRWTMADARA
jgi:hypothetical protein